MILPWQSRREGNSKGGGAQVGLKNIETFFFDQRKTVNKLVYEAKRTYFVGLIDDCGTDSKRLFTVSNMLLNRTKSSPLPSNNTSEALAHLFGRFFQSKIELICRQFSPNVTVPLPVRTSAILSSLRPTTSVDIESLLRKTPSKTCDLDPISSKLVKDCASTFAPIISNIINLSFQQASVPSALKLAFIRPLLKRSSLDPEVLNNYRLISNLPFLPLLSADSYGRPKGPKLINL